MDNSSLMLRKRMKEKVVESNLKINGIGFTMPTRMSESLSRELGSFDGSTQQPAGRRKVAVASVSRHMYQ